MTTENIEIEVRTGFAVPDVYLGADILLRELALTIGAKIVQKYFIEIEDQESTSFQELISITKREFEGIKRSHENSLLKMESVFQRSVTSLASAHQQAVSQLLTPPQVQPILTTPQVITAPPAIIGKNFQEEAEVLIRKVFSSNPTFSLEDTHTAAHSGDMVINIDGLRILVELKAYDPKAKIPTKEIEKFCRDLESITPRCDAGIMLSARSEITGYYTFGPIEVSLKCSSVPVMFISKFLTLGDPEVTLHMTKVFLCLVKKQKIEEVEIVEDSEKENKEIMEECIKRCNAYLSDLSRDSKELLKQVACLKSTTAKLRQQLVLHIESQNAKFTGLLNLVTGGTQ